jgi:hypothetical protein
VYSHIAQNIQYYKKYVPIYFSITERDLQKSGKDNNNNNKATAITSTATSSKKTSTSTEKKEFCTAVKMTRINLSNFKKFTHRIK